MDFDKMTPQQVQLVFHVCEMLQSEDPQQAAIILQEHNWSIELAADQIITRNQRKNRNYTGNQLNPYQGGNQDFRIFKNQSFYNQNSEYLDDESTKTRRKNKENEYKNIIKSQNLQYETQLIKLQQKKEKEEADRLLQPQKMKHEKQALFPKKSKEYIAKQVKQPLIIKFRLHKQSVSFTFCKSDKIESIYQYVDYSLRDYFEQSHAQFDLIQSCNSLNLNQQKDSLLGQIFGESEREVLIVRQID